MRKVELTRPLILALLVVGLMVFAVEGLLVYRFYTSSSPTAGDPARPSDAATRDLPAGGGVSLTGSASDESLMQRAGQCEEGEDDCVQELVSGIAPEAEYIGGRIDPGSSGSSENRNILYFEDPTMQPCQHKKLEYLTSDESTSYVVVIVGQGSYEQEEKTACVPKI